MINERTCYTGIDSLLSDGVIYSDDSDKAEILNTQFKSVFNNDLLNDFNMLTMSNNVNVHDNIEDVIITRGIVLKELKLLNGNKSSGPDQIPAKVLVLKMCADVLAGPICYMLNVSFNNSTLPNEWKLSRVVPIYKRVLNPIRPIVDRCLSHVFYVS